MATEKGYQFGTFDCFGDIPVCFTVACCAPCSICMIADKIGASDTHGIGGVIFAFIATYCWPCALCCCMDKIMPCFLTQLVRKSMAKHQITVAPPPCGETQFCGALCQVCLPCTTACTLCVMMREANAGTA